MDKKVMDIRLKLWIPVFAEQARSELTNKAFCEIITLSVQISFIGSAML
ncbi:hypothetical protein [Pseudobutyrivibrio sp. LB2011]|nr:hypothetical protein [Pseudobutyrivibrio sp. LB2011]